MAFSFGNSSPNPFGTTPSSSPAFGAASQTSSNPFGAPASSSSLFGQSTPSFSGASTPNLFGTPNASQASGPSMFGAQSTPSLFGQSTPSMPFGQQPAATPFGTPGQQGAIVPFQGPAQQIQRQPAINAQILVTAAEGRWAAHSTSFGDIHPEGQKELRRLEQHVRQCREQCQQLDQCERLHSNSQQHKQDMETSSSTLKQSLQRLATRHQIHDQSGSALRERVLELMRDVEAGMRALERSSFFLKFVLGSQAQVLPAATRDRLLGPVTLPSHFLRQSMRTFEELAAQCTGVVMQQLSMVEATTPHTEEAIQALPASLSNLHSYLTYVAARIDRLAESVSTARDAFLTKRQQAGHYTDPFVEADENEAAAAQAAKQHPARPHAQIQPSQQAGAAQPASVGLPSPAPAPAANPFSSFGTPSSAPAFQAQGGLNFGSQPPAASGPANLFGTPAGAMSAPAFGGFQTGGVTAGGPRTSTASRRTGTKHKK